MIGAKRRGDVSVVDQPPSVKGAIVAASGISSFFFFFSISRMPCGPCGRRAPLAAEAWEKVVAPASNELVGNALGILLHSSWTRPARFPQLGHGPQALRAELGRTSGSRNDDCDRGGPGAAPHDRVMDVMRRLCHSRWPGRRRWICGASRHSGRDDGPGGRPDREWRRPPSDRRVVHASDRSAIDS